MYTSNVECKLYKTTNSNYIIYKTFINTIENGNRECVKENNQTKKYLFYNNSINGTNFATADVHFDKIFKISNL